MCCLDGAHAWSFPDVRRTNATAEVGTHTFTRRFTPVGARVDLDLDMCANTLGLQS